MKAEFKNIKVRKEQTCNYCEKPILKGENAQVMKTRMPKFKDEKQIGVEYIRVYLHPDDYMCWDKV